MRTSTRRGLAVAVHRCHHGPRARRVLGSRRPRRQRQRRRRTSSRSPRSSCSCSGCRRRSSPATTSHSTRATSRRRASTTSRSSPRAATSCRRTPSSPATSTSRSPGCPKVLGTLEATGVELTDIAQVFQKSGTLQVSWAGDGIESRRRLRGQAHRLVGLRQRVGDLRRDGGRGPRREHRLDHDAGLQHERAAGPRRRRRPGDDLQRVGADPRGRQPRHRRAVPAGGLRRRQLRGHRGRHAPGRHLGRHRAARRRPGLRRRRGALPQGHHEGLDLRAGQPGRGRGRSPTTPRSTPRPPSRSAPCTSSGR